MSWPTNVTFDKALRQTDEEAVALKTELTRARGLITSGAQIRRGVHSWARRIQRALDVWDEAAALTGIVQYVRDEKNNQSLDVAAEFIAMRNAAAAIQAEIISIVPTDSGTGALLLQTSSAQGDLTDLTMSVAEMSTLVPLIDTYIAAVD